MALRIVGSCSAEERMPPMERLLPNRRLLVIALRAIVVLGFAVEPVHGARPRATTSDADDRARYGSSVLSGRSDAGGTDCRDQSNDDGPSPSSIRDRGGCSCDADTAGDRIWQ
jgi:hypothetical protein